MNLRRRGHRTRRITFELLRETSRTQINFRADAGFIAGSSLKAQNFRIIRIAADILQKMQTAVCSEREQINIAVAVNVAGQNLPRIYQSVTCVGFNFKRG